MKTYTYNGNQPHNATIRVKVDDKFETMDIRMEKGGLYELPEDNAHIRSLVSTKKLTEVNNIAKN